MDNPYMVDWAITNKCNLSCLHCRGMNEEELDSETILRVAKDLSLLNPNWVIIEGGEPLLCGELLSVIEIIHKKGIKIYLISNGMLLNESFAKNFSNFNVSLMLSIDGADKETYERIRKGASFEKLKEAVEVAKKFNILDSCNVTVGKHNFHQTRDFFNFAREVGFKKITFIGLKPCKDYEKYVLNGEDYKEFFSSIISCEKDYQMDVYVDEPFFKPFLKEHNINYSVDSQNGIIVSNVSNCIFGNYIFIETNGDVKPCTFAPMKIDNVKEKPLTDIWNEYKKSELLKRIRDFSTRDNPCKECEHLFDCGGCRSRTYNLTGNWLAGDPSCPLRSI